VPTLANQLLRPLEGSSSLSVASSSKLGNL
jgi:hypothetical protein